MDVYTPYLLKITLIKFIKINILSLHYSNFCSLFVMIGNQAFYTVQ